MAIGGSTVSLLYQLIKIDDTIISYDSVIGDLSHNNILGHSKIYDAYRLVAVRVL